MIEVEVRTFITKKEYDQLLKKYIDKIKTEKQISNYYDCPQDFRLMETNSYLQLWLKGGQMHDDCREERIVKIDNVYRQKLKEMLNILGFNIEIKWYRIRNKLTLDDNIEICIDYTTGYGYILEVEKLVEKEEEVEDAKKQLMEIINDNQITMSEKKEFSEKYAYYKDHWRECTKDINEEEFLN